MATEEKIRKLAEALNPRELLFAAGVIKGMPLNDSYIDAGYNASTPHSMNTNSYRLRNKPHVKAYIDAHLEEITTDSICSIKRRQEILSEMIEDTSLYVKHRQSAIDLLNRMDRIYTGDTEDEEKSAKQLSLMKKIQGLLEGDSSKPRSGESIL